MGFPNGCHKQQTISETHTNNVVFSVDVNVEEYPKTNQFNSATQNNLQWFNESSTYIWDDWKSTTHDTEDVVPCSGCEAL